LRNRHGIYRAWGACPPEGDVNESKDYELPF
jgi:hypothetical protein